MKKRYLLALILAISMFLLAGCEKVADETQIRTDLTNYYDFLDDGERIVEMEITERETEKKNNIDVIYCMVTTEDNLCSYEKKAVLTYTYDDNNGWVLDYVSVNHFSEWNITPLTGINKEEICASLSGMTVLADGEEWYISNTNIVDITIEEQDTDTENKNDTVVLTLKIDDTVQQATGRLEVTYVFDNKWKLETVSVNENFTAVTKPGMELNMTEEILIEAVEEQIFVYGVDGVRTQEISVSQNEMSDFTIVNQEISQKGTAVTYFCTCTLTKENATFGLEIEIPYYYSDGWNIAPMTISAECISIDVLGKWTGTNVYGRVVELNISEIDENGNIIGTYTDEGDQYHKGYSYNISGKIDLNTLILTLKAGDVIGEVPYEWFMAEDITAVLKVDDSAITGNADLQFTVSQ